MIKIFISTKLTSLVDKKLVLALDTSPNDNFRQLWNAHLFTIDRRKCILATNKMTLYSVVLLDILKKDVKFFGSVFHAALLDQLKADNLFDREEERYWSGNNVDFTFIRTDNDKKVIGSMNDFIFQLKAGITYGSNLLRVVNNTSAGIYTNSITMTAIGNKNPTDKYQELKNNA